jgi:hypothetical protein
MGKKMKTEASRLKAVRVSDDEHAEIMDVQQQRDAAA